MPSLNKTAISPLEAKLCWRLTRHCNLSCLHCLAGHANTGRSDLSTIDRERAADVIVSAGVRRLTWSGGEPTLCPDFPALLERVHRMGIRSTITTHGLSLRDVVLSTAKRELDCFRLSFDGLREVHNLVRKANVFDRTLNEMRRLRTLGFRVEANVSAMKLNVGDLPELVRCLADNGVAQIVVMGLIQRESAVDNKIESLSGHEFTKVAEMLAGVLDSFPSVGLRINDYSEDGDRYVVIESDGEILLLSEQMEDRSFGLVTDANGAQALRAALHEQTLLHRHVVRVSDEHKVLV